jgi:hypothetical protein
VERLQAAAGWQPVELPEQNRVITSFDDTVNIDDALIGDTYILIDTYDTRVELPDGYAICKRQEVTE